MQERRKNALKTGDIHRVMGMGNGTIFIEGCRINPFDLQRVIPLDGQFEEQQKKGGDTRDSQGRCEAAIRDAMFQGHQMDTLIAGDLSKVGREG